MVARRTGWCKEVHLSTSMVSPNPTVEETCLSSSICRVKAVEKPFKSTVPLVQEPSHKSDARALIALRPSLRSRFERQLERKRGRLSPTARTL